MWSVVNVEWKDDDRVVLSCAYAGSMVCHVFQHAKTALVINVRMLQSLNMSPIMTLMTSVMKRN